MPTYVFKNNETDELEEHLMKIAELDEFKEKNPHLTVQVGAPSMVTGVRSTLSMAGNEWQDTLKEIKKNSGRGNTIKV